MSHTAMVNYHVHATERQAFEIDAGGVVGAILSPELVETEVPLHDLRGHEGDVSFASDGVAFANVPTNVREFGAHMNWQSAYDAELADLLTLKLNAREVVIFDHTVRVDDPESDRKPARNVHSDYSPEGAEKRLVDILGAESATEWSKGHYAFINIWRPLETPINSAPLGFGAPFQCGAGGLDPDRPDLS